MTSLANVIAVAAIVPLVFFPALLILAILIGAIRPTGLWRDSFASAEFSPARVFQFIAALVAVAAVLIGLIRSGGTAFAPLPPWLLAAAGGANAIYLGAKWNSCRRSGVGVVRQGQ